MFYVKWQGIPLSSLQESCLKYVSITALDSDLNAEREGNYCSWPEKEYENTQFNVFQVPKLYDDYYLLSIANLY